MDVIKYLWKGLEIFTRETNSVVNILRSYSVKLTNVGRKSNTGHWFLRNLIYEKENENENLWTLYLRIQNNPLK